MPGPEHFNRADDLRRITPPSGRAVMSSYLVPTECVLDLRSNWQFVIEEPTGWVHWLLDFTNPDRKRLRPGSLWAMPMAGRAGANWHLATLADTGDDISVLEVAIETGRNLEVEELVSALDWTSPDVQRYAGKLAWRCLAGAGADLSDSLLRHGSVLIGAGADLGEHWAEAAVYDTTSSFVAGTFSQPGAPIGMIPAYETLAVALPLALAMSKTAEPRRALRKWCERNPQSLELARFAGGSPEGGTILHACVWADDAEMLGVVLQAVGGRAPALMEVRDCRGRSALDLAVATLAEECEVALRSHTGRSLVRETLAQIDHLISAGD